METLVRDILQTEFGDADLDGDVDFTDFVVLSTNFGSADASWSTADFDGDRLADFSDFVILGGNFGFVAMAHARHSQSRIGRTEISH